MNKLIVTLCSGETFQDISRLTYPFLSDYANKVGAHIITLGGIGRRRHLMYRKFDILNEFDRGYERILYVDLDVVIKPSAPDLFEQIPESHIGMFDESRYNIRSKASMIPYFKMYAQEKGNPKIAETLRKKWGGQYYNAGVILLSKQHKSLFQLDTSEIISDQYYHEQGYLNVNIIQHDLPVQDIGYKFNCQDFRKHNDSFFIHVTRSHKKLERIQAVIDSLKG